ncbi:MAG: hypothetical protein JRJ62_00085 [Deltaproteobacteria bacterium]|nr:hypothetical protein [Deltaproteobacteria bacterium]
MPAPVKFLDFVEQLGLEQHQLNTDTLKMALTNVLPVNSQTVFDPVTLHAAPAAANGYTAGGDDVLNTWSESAGTATLSGTDITITATAGGIGPFQYIVLYNDTNPTDMLVFYYDHGSSITLADGESFVIDILTNIFTLV